MDINSFVLGFSMGKKRGGGSAVLTELTVTENGVYDEPVIAGGNTITWDGVVGNKVVVFFVGEDLSDPDTMAFVKVSDIILSADAYVGSAITLTDADDGEITITLEPSQIGEMGGVLVAGELFVLTVPEANFASNLGLLPADIVFPEAGTYFVYTASQYVTSATFTGDFVTTPADGWNKVTVNVAGDIVDVDELPAENVDEEKIYRVAEYADTVSIYLNDGDSVATLEERLDSEVSEGEIGGYIKGAYTTVDVLPNPSEVPPLVDGTIPVYVLRETGEPFIYVNGERTSVIDTANQMFQALLGYPETYSFLGIADDKDSITEVGYYTVFGREMVGTTYGIPDEADNKTIYEHNGSEWVECGGVELNIAYGDVPPEDTTKLWVKTTEPSGVVVTNKLAIRQDSGDSNVEKIYELSETSKIAGVAAYCGGKVHILGGRITGINSPSKSHYIIDPEANTVINHCNSHTTTAYPGIGVVGEKIYIFGGGSGSMGTPVATIVSFDTVTDTLTTLSAKITTSTKSIGCVSVGTKIYLFGGQTSNSFSNYIYCFDAESETVTKLDATLPIQGVYRCVYDGNRIFLFIGNIVYEFSEEDYTVKLLGAHDKKVDAVVSVNGAVYCVYHNDYTTSLIGAFDKEAATIEEIASLPMGDLPGYINDFEIAATDEKIFICGGYRYYEVGTVAFNNRLFCAYPNLPIYEADSGKVYLVSSANNTFEIISNETVCVESGVSKVYKGNADGIAEPVEAALYKGDAWTNI